MSLLDIVQDVPKVYQVIPKSQPPIYTSVPLNITPIATILPITPAISTTPARYYLLKDKSWLEDSQGLGLDIGAALKAAFIGTAKEQGKAAVEMLKQEAKIIKPQFPAIPEQFQPLIKVGTTIVQKTKEQIAKQQAESKKQADAIQSARQAQYETITDIAKGSITPLLMVGGAGLLIFLLIRRR